MTMPSDFQETGQEKEAAAMAEEHFTQDTEARKRVSGAELSDVSIIRQTLLAAKEKRLATEANGSLAQEMSEWRNCDTLEDGTEPLKSINAGSNLKYSALSRDKREIRLLTVCAGAFEDEIRCKLNSISLEAKPTYMALSYCWGEQSDRGEVTVDEQKASVMKSLEIALRYLRDSRKDVVVWADAMCINQENLEEKSHQVRLMGDIYANGGI
jgi:hypothetical protein